VITPDYPPATGGIQLLMARVAEGLSRFEPTVVTRAAPIASPPPAIAVRRTRTMRGRTSLLELNALAATEAALRPPDVILCGHLIAAPSARLAKLRSRAPIVTYLYADEVPGHPRFSRFAIRQSDAVISISGYTSDLALRYGARAERLELIPPGVDFADAAAHLGASSSPTVVTVARLEDRYKGHDVMLEAMLRVREQVPGARWIVLGEGWLRPELEARARDLDLDGAVEFRGRVGDDERDAALAAADVFAMPSRLPANGTGGEGFGIVYLEAAVHGVPSVAGNAGGAVDAVIDGETGLLVDAADPAAVAGALVRLLQDEDLRRRLGTAARARAREFAWPRIADRVDELLWSVTAAT
jgi:phosphatidylinositol alpha-1,6-mannosyltransferase